MLLGFKCCTVHQQLGIPFHGSTTSLAECVLDLATVRLVSAADLFADLLILGTD